MANKQTELLREHAQLLRQHAHEIEVTALLLRDQAALLDRLADAQ